MTVQVTNSSPTITNWLGNTAFPLITNEAGILKPETHTLGHLWWLLLNPPQNGLSWPGKLYFLNKCCNSNPILSASLPQARDPVPWRQLLSVNTSIAHGPAQLLSAPFRKGGLTAPAPGAAAPPQNRLLCFPPEYSSGQAPSLGQPTSRDNVTGEQKGL